MGLIINYLREKKEKRKQERFLNTRIPSNELFVYKMAKCVGVEHFGETPWEMGERKKLEFDSIKILRKIKKGDGYSYIDPIVGTEYKEVSHYSVKQGDIGVAEIIELDYSEEVIKRQYLTIADIMKVNKKLKQNK